MPDMEKVIKELECCVSLNHNGSKCVNCDYADESYHGDCETYLLRDALALLKAQEQKCRKCGEATSKAIQELQAKLKAQEPKVMKVGEVRNWVNSDRVTREPVFIEMRSGVCAWIIDDEVREIPGAENLTSDLYSKTWRCWTSRPTDAQREAAKWE